MIEFLVKLFIKDCDDVKNPKVREKYGVLCGIVGICFNFLLFVTKLLAGIFSSSVAVLADAFNNLSDASSSIVGVAGFKMSVKKADAEHPFGHGRMEYIAALVVSFLILVVGYELFKSSIQTIFHPKELDTSYFTIGILFFSILIKFYMFHYNRELSKKINSKTLEATSRDSLNDVISTSVVLISVIFVKVFPNVKIPFDGIAGIVVALFILTNGIDSLKDVINPILGTRADKDFVLEIEKEVLKHKPICSIHDLIVHDYGPGRMILSLHAEVPGDKNIFDLHEVIDDAEKAIAKKFNCSVTIHMDPVDFKNKEYSKIKKYLSSKAKKIDSGISVHDIHIVPGKKHTNVIFDVVRPFECLYTDSELTKKFSALIKKYNKKYNAVIHIDDPFA